MEKFIMPLHFLFLHVHVKLVFFAKRFHDGQYILVDILFAPWCTQWLKCIRTQRNVVPLPRENGSRHSPTSDFLWMQGNGRGNDMEAEHGLTV